MGSGEYEARVREVKEKRVSLEFLRSDLPLSFRSRSVLPVDSASKVVIEVSRLPARDIAVGDRVLVLLEERNRIGWSVFWTSIFPVLFFVLTYSGFYSLVKDVRMAGIGAAVLLLPYYSFLWLLRDAWSKEFVFRLK